MTKQHLKARWETSEGKQKAEALQKAFNSGTTEEQLHSIVDTLPYANEVAPALDLRGVQLDDHIFVSHLSLPGVTILTMIGSHLLKACPMMKKAFLSRL